MQPQQAPASGRPQANARLGLVGLLLALFWATVAIYFIMPALPYNPVRLPFVREVNSLALAPQGWAFFTRNPREEKQTLYAADGRGRWRLVSRAPHAHPRNAFGLNRRSRAQSHEAAFLIQSSRSDAWQRCGQGVAFCLARLPRGTRVRNPGLRPTLCGRVAIVMQEPVPWAWLRSRSRVTMPARILPLEVQC